MRRQVVDLQMQLGNCMQRLSDERVARHADPTASQLVRENERLKRENLALQTALARGGSGGQALHEALAAAQADLERANHRAAGLRSSPGVISVTRLPSIEPCSDCKILTAK